MPHVRGEIREIWLDGDQAAGWIDCPPNILPAPGQYVLAASAEDDPAEPLSLELFPGYAAGPIRAGGLVVSPPLPSTWLPGALLDLRGPFGTGFRLPGLVGRLALAAAGDSLSRLLPLAQVVLAQSGEVTLFSDLPLPESLPAEVEAAPLAALGDSLSWPDFLAVDLDRADLGELRSRLGLPAELRLPFPAQSLLTGRMPCAAVGAECGLCAVRARSGWRLACKDGPVFDLSELEW
ncbi:MAG TPA: hypothetical protein VMT46_16040 [Anaerolineaceae bacterium]|nr:hypothetical protein [Anaerolineaceae bacterium]